MEGEGKSWRRREANHELTNCRLPSCCFLISRVAPF